MVPKYFLALLLGHHFSLRIVLSKLEKLQLFFMPSLHPTQQLNHVLPKQKIVIFWPNNKSFLHFTQLYFINQQQNLIHNEIFWVWSYLSQCPNSMKSLECIISLKLQLLASFMEIVATTSSAKEIVHLTT